LFACGHGDTILVRLPDGRWVLVDCYLPKTGGVRSRFFDFVEEKQIQTLALVFQTHPDYDHFLGMHDVLSHFIESDGKSVGFYFDSGLTVQQIRELLVQPKRPGQREYRRLQQALRAWDKQGDLDWRELDAERPSVSPKGSSGRIDFVPIGPDAKAKRRLTEASIEAYAKNPNAKLEANELSLVVVLAVNDGNMKFNVLLAADASSSGISRALKVWRDHAQERSTAAHFQAIKVPHHGSLKNHFTDLCRLGGDDAEAKVAAVSAGERDALPDREVLADFLDAGWTVVLTSYRTSRAVNRPGELHLRSAAKATFEENTIELGWNFEGGFSFGPPSAVLDREHLTAYQTAKA